MLMVLWKKDGAAFEDLMILEQIFDLATQVHLLSTS